ncbi:MAG: glycosyltransferase family 4 protein [Anaerolineae bacterium]|nr:glycosyltransferase family 4 protein [Anaerolineae bacterium]
MKIVFIAPFATTPKATVSARMIPIATALVAQGHQVNILIPPYDNVADSGQVWLYSGVSVENVKLGSNPNSALGYLQQANKLAARVLAIQPDVIHVFKPVGPGALAMWLLRVLKRSTIPIFVDNDDWEGAGGWVDVNPYGWLQKQVMMWQERWCLRNAAGVTCASHALMQRTHELCTPNVPKLALFPNGPDSGLHSFIGDQERIRHTLRDFFGWGAEPVIIYVGTVPNGHDMDVAVQAMERVSQAHHRLRWCIIGTGDGMPSLRAMVKEANISGAVEFHSFMPHEDVLQRMVAADIALYPYRDSNINRAKCAGKVVDYMVCGKPMVVSDVGMNRVYVEHQRSGLLTQPGNVDDFAQALLWMLDNDRAARSLGEAAQQRIWDVFGWERRVGEWLAIYA